VSETHSRVEKEENAFERGREVASTPTHNPPPDFSETFNLMDT
jgi:hypothetical protein